MISDKYTKLSLTTVGLHKACEHLPRSLHCPFLSSDFFDLRTPTKEGMCQLGLRVSGLEPELGIRVLVLSLRERLWLQDLARYKPEGISETDCLELPRT